MPHPSNGARPGDRKYTDLGALHRVPNLILMTPRGTRGKDLISILQMRKARLREAKHFAPDQRRTGGVSSRVSEPQAPAAPQRSRPLQSALHEVCEALQKVCLLRKRR